MNEIIDLKKPVGFENGRGFRPAVFIYQCSKGHRVRVRAGSFRGKTPVPALGGICCPQCEPGL